MRAFSHNQFNCFSSFVGLLLLIIGCGGQYEKQQEGHISDEHSHQGHHHEPPHGGTVVRLGDELFHLELVKDSHAGLMRCYVMDGHLEHFIRIAQASIEVLVEQQDGKLLTWMFTAVENRATGETLGNSSEFQAPLAALKDQNKFVATIPAVHIQNQRFENISFSFPEGNESK